MTKAAPTRTLGSMQGDATVLLVSVGQPSEGLQAELQRLQVKVVPSGFADAEEEMAEADPDLVVLSGARGAMELATLLDDQVGENRPRMVIVAERKDLAKLRGLNREVVISLFALETTEKVVAQRIESLARRAARRRHPSEDGAPQQRTAMGIPLASVTKTQLQKAPAPPRVNSALTSGPASAPGRHLSRPPDSSTAVPSPASVELSPPPPSIKPDEERPRQPPKAEGEREERSAPQVPPQLHSPRAHLSTGSEVDRRTFPREEGAESRGAPLSAASGPKQRGSNDADETAVASSGAGQGPATVKGIPRSDKRLPRDPQAPTSLQIPRPVQVDTPRAAPPRPAFAEASSTPAQIDSDIGSLLPEDELVSLRPSEFSEEDEVTKVADIPGDAALPRFDEEQTEIVPAVASGTSNADALELDISAAEQALENLESVKLDLSDELRDAARQRMAVSPDGSSEPPLAHPSPDFTDRKTPYVPLDAPPEAPAPMREEPLGEMQGRENEVGAADEEDQAGSPQPAQPSQHEMDDLLWPGERSPAAKPAFAATQLAPASSPFALQSLADLEKGIDGDSWEENARVGSPDQAALPVTEERPSSVQGTTTVRKQPSSEVTKTIPSRVPPAQLATKEKERSAKKGGGVVPLLLAAATVGAIGVGALSGAFERDQPRAIAEVSQSSPHSQESGDPPPSTSSQADKKAASAPAAERSQPGSDDPDQAPTPAAVTSEGTPPAAPGPLAPARGVAPDLAPSKTGPSGAAPETGAATSPPLKDPFLVEEADVPSCEKLLGSALPQPGADPVHEASVVWNAARKAIVEGKVDEAHRRMCEAIHLNPESVAMEGLAALYLRLGAPRQALGWLERAEKLRPGQKELVALRGDIYSQLGRNDEARNLWLGMLALQPEQERRIQAVSKDYSVDAGKSLRRGDRTLAEMWFRRAVVLDPQNVAAIMGLAKTFHRAGKRAHAKAFALRALAVSDVIPEIHVLLGEIALDEGNAAEAKKRFERALEVRPGFFPAKRGLSQVVKQ